MQGRSSDTTKPQQWQLRALQTNLSDRRAWRGLTSRADVRKRNETILTEAKQNSLQESPQRYKREAVWWSV